MGKTKMRGRLKYLGAALCLCAALCLGASACVRRIPAHSASGQPPEPETADGRDAGALREETLREEVLRKETLRGEPLPEAPLRLGYCQSESYYEFDEQLYYLVKGMEEYGLMPEVTDRGGFDETVLSQELWQYLCRQDQTGWRVRFVPEAYISMDGGSESETAGSELANGVERDQILSKMMDEQDIGLLITMGTKAGLAAGELTDGTPFMNFMAADPVSSGIVKGTAVSGMPGAWASVDPGNFTRSMSVMYDIFRPKTIGVVYADNEEAYIYSGAQELDRFCRDSGVEVKREYVEDTFTEDAYETYVENLRAAHARLAGQVDVFILTTSLLEQEDYPRVLEPFYEAGVPVYSINSVVDVEYGALMAVEASDYQNIGRFGADTMRRFLGGEKLGDLNQIYQTAPFLVLNYTTAKRIGYRPDFTMLCSTSRIYR